MKRNLGKIFFYDFATDFKEMKIFLRYFYTVQEQVCFLLYKLGEELGQNSFSRYGLENYRPETFLERKADFIEEALSNYFLKKEAINLPFVFLSGTTFQKKVWMQVAKIKLGEVSTYQKIAEAIGKPKAFRAVGTAVGKNPLSIIVPCHRILHSGEKKVGKYAGGEKIKQELLLFEGINLPL